MKNFHTGEATFISHVHLNVSDLTKMVQFYENVIGLHVLEQSANTAMLGVGEEAFLTLHAPEAVKPKQHRETGLYHFAILVPTARDLGVVLRHFINLKIPLGAADHIVSEALYLSDPEGNGIEIYADIDSDMWTWESGYVTMSTLKLDHAQLLQLSEGEAWNGLPEGTKMGHLHLHVSQLEDARQFYETLGFQVVSELPTALFMSTEGYHHHIAVNVWNGTNIPTPASETIGLRGAVMQFKNNEALEEAVQRLREANFSVSTAQNGYEVKDPSGNTYWLKG